MRQLGLFSFILILITSTQLHSQELDTVSYTMTPLFQVGDSIILTSTPSEQLFYKHIIQPRQTLYSLSNFFGLDVFSLYNFNPELSNKIVSVGDTIKVPIKGDKITMIKSLYKRYLKVYYRVNDENTPFGIRYRMFNMDKDLFYHRNAELKSGMKINQLLFIGYIPQDGIKADTMAFLSPVLTGIHMNMQKLFHLYNPKNLVIKKGMGFWNPSQENQSGFYVICDNAPINSYVEITNPMYNRLAYAKVIAHIPNNTYRNEVLVIVSPSLANYLGVMNSRFFVKLRYLQESN